MACTLGALALSRQGLQVALLGSLAPPGQADIRAYAEKIDPTTSEDGQPNIALGSAGFFADLQQVMIGGTADDFMAKELVPRLPELLKLDYELSRALLRKAGELGLLGIEVPEEYGGLGLDKVSGCLVSEQAGLGRGAIPGGGPSCPT